MAKVKDIFNESRIEKLSSALQSVCNTFDKTKFYQCTYSDDWKTLEFKQRVRRISSAMGETLPDNYEETLSILGKVAPSFDGLTGIIFPDYVEQYGLNKWESSMKALEYFTQFSTSEFAVRPFLLADQDKMLEQMDKWSKNENEHVRRLASEGCRPRLPWGQSIPSLKENPLPTIPILMNLIKDNSLYVRKSVANHLNDMTKTHPDIILEMLHQEYGKDQRTDWILRHASRSLLKQGHKEALALFGYQDNESICICDLTVDNDPISIGDSLPFSFHILTDATAKVRIEYAIDYVKKRGNRNKKVFKITETELKSGQKKQYIRKQSFKNMTTRVHYPGVHTLSIIVNGTVKASCDFHVK